jgi:hypothetical protein
LILGGTIAKNDPSITKIIDVNTMKLSVPDITWDDELEFD